MRSACACGAANDGPRGGLVGLRLFRRKRDDASQANVDAMVLDQLRNLGADLTKPRDARFYLYVRTEADAKEAASELAREGYATETRESAQPSPEHPWLILANRDMVVDDETIAEARRLFDGLAARLGGDYDGWEAAAD